MLPENVKDLTQEQYEELKENLEELQKEVKFLDCLSAAGVDNWDGYSYAQELMEDE